MGVDEALQRLAGGVHSLPERLQGPRDCGEVASHYLMPASRFASRKARSLIGSLVNSDRLT